MLLGCPSHPIRNFLGCIWATAPRFAIALGVLKLADLLLHHFDLLPLVLRLNSVVPQMQLSTFRKLKCWDPWQGTAKSSFGFYLDFLLVQEIVDSHFLLAFESIELLLDLFVHIQVLFLLEGLPVDYMVILGNRSS